MMMIVIMMIIASYTDDDDRHHDNDCMQARVLSCTPAAAAPIENRIILSVGAAAAVIFPGDILLMGAAVAGADKGTMGLGYMFFLKNIFPLGVCLSGFRRLWELILNSVCYFH